MARKSAVRRLLKKLPAAPFREILEASPEPFVKQGTLGVQTSVPTPEAVLPEDEYALECRALERLRDASGGAELEAAWAQTQVEYRQAGLEISAAVANGYQELRDVSSEDIQDPELDEWNEQYDRAPGIER